MRCNVIAGGLLLSTALLCQEPVRNNVVPNSAIDGAMRRAFTMPMGAPNELLTLSSKPSELLLGTPQPKTCAIPLLNVRGARTNDKMPRHIIRDDIDPKMAVPPPMPACPSPKP